jgi:hypothetical protein
MNAEVALDPNAFPAAPKPSSGASRIIRRVHMYLALFLAPWMLMYALSAIAMSHDHSLNCRQRATDISQ